MSRFLEALHSGRVLLMDGAMGTELIRAGLDLDKENCEGWNLLHPERVTAIHRAYAEAGAKCLVTNTFRSLAAWMHREGSRRRWSATRFAENDWVSETEAAVTLARNARTPPPFVLGSVGPLLPAEIPEIFLEHGIWGAAEEAAAWCSQQIYVLGAADAILLETQSSLSVLTALMEYPRLLGVRIPLLVSFGFAQFRGRYVSLCNGCTPEEAAAWANRHRQRIAALGVNCGRDIGLDEILAILRCYRQVTDLPLFARPNAGTPAHTETGWSYPLTPEQLAVRLPELLEAGISMFGGCCGTTPAHIAACRPVVDQWNRRQPH